MQLKFEIHNSMLFLSTQHLVFCVCGGEAKGRWDEYKIIRNWLPMCLATEEKRPNSSIPVCILASSFRHKTSGWRISQPSAVMQDPWCSSPVSHFPIPVHPLLVLLGAEKVNDGQICLSYVQEFQQQEIICIIKYSLYSTNISQIFPPCSCHVTVSTRFNE